MRLPSPLYEGLPYLYLVSGLAVMLADIEAQLSLIVGLALYILGSLVWITRSNARRRDRYQHLAELARQRNSFHSSYSPQWFYEAQPFLYLLAGIACLIYTSHPLGVISACLFFSASLFVFYSRVQHRRQPQTRELRA